MTIHLYGTPTTRAFRSLWMLEELGVPYVRVPTGLGATRTPEFLATNPNGHVPALVDGELRLFESMAINLYLAGRHGRAPFWPAGEPDRARAVQWSFWALTECEAKGFTVLFVRGGEQFDGWRSWSHTDEFRETHRSAKIPDANSAAEAEAALRAPLGVLNEQLRGSAADLNVASVLVSVLLARLDLSALPRLRDWLTRCVSRPAVARATATETALAG